MYNISAIKNYILFLKSKHDLCISLHPLKYDPIINSSELMMFNIHDNSYCAYIKTNKHAKSHCKYIQNKVFEKCSGGSFCGTCYAGVKEFVYPITNSKENIGFISVSGYKSCNADNHLKRLQEKYGFNLHELQSIYASLKTDDIEKKYIDTLIQPLCDMLELAYLKTISTSKNDSDLAVRIANYIKQFRHQSITSKDICKHFCCSRSQISSAFNSYTGKSIREYITEMRMEDAKNLLTYSSLNVTEIAYCIGFTDSNYFSYLFKKINKITPLQYRKASRNFP